VQLQDLKAVFFVKDFAEADRNDSHELHFQSGPRTLLKSRKSIPPHASAPGTLQHSCVRSLREFREIELRSKDD
jgi:hypothetical protein